MAVASTDQARIILQEQRRIENPGHLAGDGGGADVQADMALQMAPRHPHIRQAGRHQNAGIMILTGQPRNFWFPDCLRERFATVSATTLLIVAMTIVIVTGLALVIYRTKLGGRCAPLRKT